MKKYRMIYRSGLVFACATLLTPAAISAPPTMPPVPDTAPKPKCAPPPAIVLTDAERVQKSSQAKPDADLIADAMRRAQTQFPELKCK